MHDHDYNNWLVRIAAIGIACGILWAAFLIWAGFNG
jgi:hypothetical protein